MMLEGYTIRDWQGNVLTLGSLSLRAALTDPTTPFQVQPVGQTGFGDPVFSDEFQAGSLNTGKWEPYYPDTDFWNTTVPGGHLSNSNEPQGYDISGITFDADGMVLTMREEETVTGLAYTSGMVSSYPSFNPTYGYFETRMLLLDHDDAWPAFWMMPTAQVRYPEMDIMENFSQASFNLQTEHTFHTPGTGAIDGTTFNYAEDVGNNWHVYGFLWEPGRMRWYVDGTLAKDLSVDAGMIDEPMYMICNLAADQNSTPVAPFSVKVSHIRAWALPS